MIEPVRPAALVAGDLVALVSPSGPVRSVRADAAVGVLTGWELRTRLGRHALARTGYLAGTDEQRLADLNDAFADPEVRAVLCLRGGYGMQRIVDGLDLDAVRADPKLVMGFSDITALHLALWQGARLATVHGPVAAQLDKGAQSPTALGAKTVLMSSAPVTVKADEAESTFRVRSAGRAEGVLIGGNLAMLASSVGTAHMPDLTGAILLVEDVNEQPYRIDRMLTQLLRSGALTGLAGVAIGQFTECDAEGGPAAEEVLEERLAPLGVPLLGGLPIGHGDQHVAIGVGVPAVLDADAGTLHVQPVGRP
ncbi:MAG: LD-carboxypeptidase [Hamadaea sp.]|nr:LD-carboxypeptidase [Hamadaea sp.]NUR50595.1 LD-carboxypeptidase [Hamadaea sp.]